MGNQLIGGSWVGAADGATYPVLNPADGRLLDRVPRSGLEDAHAAVDAARDAFDHGPWPRKTPAERQLILLRFADLIEREIDRLAEMEVDNQGKTIKQSRDSDFPLGIDNLRFFGRLADRGWARPLIVFGGFGTGFAYLVFVLWGFIPGAVGFLLLYAFLWPAGGQVPLTFLGERLGTGAQRTELGLTENMFLAGDATGAALIGFLSGAWTLTWALAIIPGAVTLLAGGLFAWQYGIRRAERPASPDGAT